MRKSTLLVIGIIYIASIVIVSMFGLKSVVYDVTIPVLNVECINKTIGNVFVDDSKAQKVIKVKFTEAGDIESLDGTVLQLEHRVLPDDATNKEVRYEFDRDRYPQVKMHKVGDRETGAIVFTSPVLFTITIRSVDMPSVFTSIVISVTR